MPKVAIDEDDHPVPHKHKIRRTRKRPDILSVAVPTAMKRARQCTLDVGSDRSHTLHAAAPLSCCEVVCHPNLVKPWCVVAVRGASPAHARRPQATGGGPPRDGV
jgi:hypothetical protein